MFVSVQYQFGAGIGDHGAKGGRIVQTLPPVLVKQTGRPVWSERRCTIQ